MVAEVDRAIRRLESFKLKLVAAADSAGVAKDAGFTGADAWLAKTTTVSRADAARQVALASRARLRARRHRGSPGRRSRLPGARSSDRPRHRPAPRQVSPQSSARWSRRPWWRRRPGSAPTSSAASPAGRSRPSNPTRRSWTPTRTSSSAPRSKPPGQKCSLTLHDNGDGTTTGHFTIPALAAAMLGKVIDAMTAPRRMREPAAATAERQDRSFDWRHRRGLAFAELLEHLPTDHLHPKTAATVVVTIDHTVLAGAMKAAHLDTDQALSAGEARRLACNAGHPPRGPRHQVRGPRPRPRRAGCSPRPNGWPKASNTPPAPPAAANAPTPGASSTTDDPGPKAAAPTSPTRSRSAHQHHHWIHDTGFNHQTMPDGSIRFSRRT